MTNVCVFGLWHLGSVTSACLANSGYSVTGIDKNFATIEAFQKGKSPIFEPGLDDMIRKNIDNGRLQFTTESEKAINSADFIILTIDTVVDDKDRVDLSSVYDAINEISMHLKNRSTVIIQSQVPVGTCNEFIQIIKKKRPDVSFGLAYCPENLRLGKAIEVFEKPDRIIIGADDQETANKVSEFFYILSCPKIRMDLKSAEMTKHSINSFLATCISFINWVGMVCEDVGADPKMVSEGLRSESRVGRILPLLPGLGFAGGTLGRDLRILESLSNNLKIKPNLAKDILEINHVQNVSIIKKLLKLFGTLNGLKVCIFGLTYKPGTNTLRRSNSVEIINEILKLDTEVNAYDPAIPHVDTITSEKFHIYSSPYSAVEDTDILLIFTDWPEFKNLDYKKIYNKMKNPTIIDMKSFLDENILRDLGFAYSRS
jgi:UDPglucose 6-dehydrogenase